MGAKRTTLLLCFGLGAALTGPATAQEQLTMPFSCHVGGGAVSLAPSAPQAYKIYGHREKKRLTTCSPYDPGNCHNWFVYRFDLDCGGRRTSWQSVVAALSRKFADAPATRENAYTGQYGRARPMPPWAPGRPYRPGVGPAVDFPPGFAPNPMRVASFERTSPEQTSPAPAHIPLPSKKPLAPEPVLTASPQVAAIAPDEQDPSASKPKATGKTDDTAETTSETPWAEDKPAEDKRAVSKSEATKSEPVQIALSSGNQKTGPLATGSLPKSGTTGTLWRDAGIVFAVTLAALLAATALLLLRRRETDTMPMSFVRPPFKRTIRSMFTNPSRSRPSGDVAVLQRDVQAADSDASDSGSSDSGSSDSGSSGLGSSSLGSSGLRLWDEDWLPATRNEAVEVLGVDPDADPDTMKTTVKRLRRALHPDHALDEDDLVLRERRLKQINVAWDIVSGKRRAS